MKLRTFIVVHRRRDVQGEFTGEVVPTDVLRRILDAAHTAPSVGLSQPWDFVLIRDVDTRTAFRDHVQAEREISASQLDNEQFRTLRHRRCRLVLSVLGHREPVVGRDRRGARGRVGQLLREEFLRELLGIPSQLRPVAWLCLGTVRTLQTIPDLERHGWRHRIPLAQVVHEERFGRPAHH
jgi:5,6-dimethylbenzimidazole synthase